MTPDMAVKFLVSDKDGDHLPYTGDDGKPDHRLMGAAWAALHGGYRGNKYQGSNKQAAIDKLTSIYKSEGMATPGSSDHAEGLKDWFQIFRAGNYGDKGSYTEDDLQHLVDSYSTGNHEAPVVIGHPADNDPAYGWVAAVKREGPVLFAKLGDDVNPDFEEMVKKGLFKKRSVSFYRTSKGPELRHIGFLGAQPPEVKGLAAIKFEEGFETAEVVFQEDSMADKTVVEQVNEALANFFAKFTGGKKEAEFGEADVKRIVDAAVQPLKTENEQLRAQTTELKGKLDSQATSFAEREKKIAAGELSERVAGAVNQLRSAGKWLPAFEKMGLKAVFAELAGLKPVEFGEGDAKKQVAPLTLLVEFLEKLPKFAPFQGEIVSGGARVIPFAESRTTPGRAAVDTNSAQLSDLAKKRAAEKKIDFGEALRQVSQENPDLTQPAAIAGGQV